MHDPVAIASFRIFEGRPAAVFPMRAPPNRVLIGALVARNTPRQQSATVFLRNICGILRKAHRYHTATGRGHNRVPEVFFARFDVSVCPCATRGGGLSASAAETGGYSALNTVAGSTVDARLAGR